MDTTTNLPRVARDWIAALVSDERPDLSARQLAVLLLIHTETEPVTVRGAAATLNISKPAVTRAMDRLGELDLAARKIDPMDRRSVHLRRTTAGAAYLRWAMERLRDALDEEGRRMAADAIERNAAHARASQEAAAL